MDAGNKSELIAAREVVKLARWVARPRSNNLKILVEHTVASVRHHEEHTKARSRARKAADERHLIRWIEAVVCNLAHAVLLPPPTGRIATKLGKSTKRRPFDRTLRRRFVLRPGQDERFDQGGRLYGGFWQNLKTARRRHIRINGEPVTVLDFASMFTHLAYAELGVAPPEGEEPPS